MRNSRKVAALLSSAALLLTAGFASADPRTIPGWPAYIAMGAIGGPNINPPTETSTNGNDDFGGKPVDVVFKYAGVNGNGDPGIIDPPSNTLRMTSDLTTLSAINQRAMRVAIVEYTAQLSLGNDPQDFSNESTPNAMGATYIMSRHFATLGADALAMNDKPVIYNGKKHYGTLIMNPDMLGAVQQQVNAQSSLLATVNAALPAGKVNHAVDQAMCFLTTSRTYLNTSNPNGLTSAPYLNKTYNGNPVAILEQMLADGYPAYSIEGQSDTYWNIATNNLIGGSGTTYSKVGEWFNSCTSAGPYPQRPNFPAGFDGWIQANNWIIRAMSPKGNVTFGWQENLWAAGNGFWMHANLTDAQIASVYSTPISNWLQTNAPSAISTGPLGANYTPDYFLFDRYELDDSGDPGQATLYNARSWDNLLKGVGNISRNFSNIPIMLWQIPGGHIPYAGEAQPETVLGSYIFSTAPVYFFGDGNLQPDLSNIVVGTGTHPGELVGNFPVNCNLYNCPGDPSRNNTLYYKDYLRYYNGQLNNYDWRTGNGKLALAAANNVFAILWGGGNTTNVIKNFSNPDDHGWLSNKIKTYYQNPTPLVPATTTTVAAAHDFNGDFKSDVVWRDTAGNIQMWLMNGASATTNASLGNIGANWSMVGQRDFNGDGKSDILWRDTAGNVAMWLMNGTAVSQVASLGNIGTNWSVAAIGDFGGDGKGDVLWRDTAGNVVLWVMNGTSASQVVSLGSIGANWNVAGTADFNGDGKSDVLWRDTAGNLAMWLMNGTSVSSVASLGNIGTTWSVAGTADFNGDGKGDVLWRNTAGDIVLWLMNGTSASQVVGLGNIGSGWTVSSNGDYNGDGKGDVLWRSSTGDIALWLMNGTAVLSVTGLGNIATNWSVQNANAN